MSTQTLPRLPLVVDAPVIHATHACRWCGVHECGQDSHDRTFVSGETYARMTLAQRNACPSCGGDVRDDGPCISAVAR